MDNWAPGSAAKQARTRLLILGGLEGVGLSGLAPGTIHQRCTCAPSPPPHTTALNVDFTRSTSVHWATLTSLPFSSLPLQAGVNADAISHEDYLNGPGEKVTNKFDVAGTYG